MDSWVYLTKTPLAWKAKFMNPSSKREAKKSQDLVQAHDFMRITFPHFDSELNADYNYESAASGQEIHSRKYLGEYAEERDGLKSIWMLHTCSFEGKKHLGFLTA